MVGVNLLFAYGTLRKGHAAHHFMRNATYLKTAKLFGFSLYNLGAFPGILHAGPSAYVVGDVFKLERLDVLSHLDRYEGYNQANEANSLYLRRLVNVMGDEMWTYIYNHDVPFERRIASGDWNNRIELVES